MKAVMISIQPKWVEKIANGQKTIEVRKTRPKLETPFKVYIYCTKQGKWYVYGGLGDKECLFRNPDTGKIKFDFAWELMCCHNEYSRDNFLSGKVIGEFVCDRIIGVDIDIDGIGIFNRQTGHHIEKETCLTRDEAWEYLSNKIGYGWHISDLKIYEKPKELWEFFTKGDCDAEICYMCSNFHMGRGWLDASYKDEDDCIVYGIKPLTRPPQSWCYLEEKENEE